MRLEEAQPESRKAFTRDHRLFKQARRRPDARHRAASFYRYAKRKKSQTILRCAFETMTRVSHRHADARSMRARDWMRLRLDAAARHPHVAVIDARYLRADFDRADCHASARGGALKFGTA